MRSCSLFIFLIDFFFPQACKINKIKGFAGLSDNDRKRRLGLLNNEIPTILTWGRKNFCPS